MAGISQVWLTEKELTDMLIAWNVTDRQEADLVTPHMRSGFDKLKLALEPVACKV